MDKSTNVHLKNIPFQRTTTKYGASYDSRNINSACPCACHPPKSKIYHIKPCHNPILERCLPHA